MSAGGGEYHNPFDVLIMRYLVLFFSTFMSIVLTSCSSDKYVHISVSSNTNENEMVEYLCKDNIPVYRRITTPDNRDNTEYEEIKTVNNVDDYEWVYNLKYFHSTAQDDSRFYDDPNNYYKGTVRDFGFDRFYMNSTYYSLLDNLLKLGDVCLELTDSTILYRGLRKKTGDNAMLVKYNLDHRKINNICITVRDRLINRFRIETDKDTSIVSLFYSKDTLKSVVFKSFSSLKDTTIIQERYNYNTTTKD